MILIVGAGIFGSLAARLAVKAGYKVTIIDCAKPLAASKCSSGLIRSSWVKSLGPAVVDTGYRVLRSLTPLISVNFTVLPTCKAAVLDWVDYATLLWPVDVTDTVEEIGEGSVTLGSGRVLRGKVLVATGAYSGHLLPLPGLKGLVGASLRIPGEVPKPLMQVYAPYRQAMAFNIAPGTVWAGDGTAILEKNWEPAPRIAKLRQRAEDFFNLTGGTALVGSRPYLDKGGYFARAGKNTWVSTGGAKNGTLLAAYQAQRFLEEL